MLCKMLTLGKMNEGILCMYFYNFFYKSKIIQTLKKIMLILSPSLLASQLIPHEAWK